MEYNFKKVHTGKDLTISLILTAAGIGLFFLNGGVGITVAVGGILCLLFYRGGFKCNGQGDLLTRDIFELSMASKPSLADFLNGKDIIPSIRKGSEGGTLHLTVYSNKDRSIGYAQLQEFCHFAYEPVTGIVELSSLQTGRLFSELEQAPSSSSC